MNCRLPALLLVLATSPALAASPKAHMLQVADVQALTQPPPSMIAKPVQAMAVIGLQPAPMPDPDAEPPHGGASTEGRLAPALMSPPLLFQGNGFSHASNRDYGVDQRTTPAAGLNWSVPVK